MPDDATAAGRGHRQRLREKFMHAGDKALFDYEILEMLLAYAIPRRDVKPLAKKLIGQYHSLNGVLDALPEELAKSNGLGEYSACLIALVRAMMTRYLEQDVRNRDFLSSSDHFCNYARTRIGNRHEEVM